MLDRTRPESTEQIALDLNALLRRIFDATLPTLDARGVRLDARLAPVLPAVRGDADRLQQVFINLVNNAIDAMPGGGELRVSTSVKSDDDNGGAARVVVEFADTGTGMTAEVRARIFDPLYTTKERGRGTGLGLVVVSQAVADHGGGIEVESSPGGGSRFRLSFPAAAREAAPADEAQTQAVEG
jgi:signal transduction histidine kinase